MLLAQLPPELEDVESLMTRRSKAAEKKELWRGTYTEVYRYAMPTRELFTWSQAGQEKAHRLFDSTLQECTYEAANTMCALLFPTGKHWMKLAPSPHIPKEKIPNNVLIGLKRATETFFAYLDGSNFSTVVNETALDLIAGTGSLDFDEGETNEEPFVFTAVPLPALELEEGPNGKVETTYTLRKPPARHLLRMYRGMNEIDLSPETQQAVHFSPDKEIEIVQAEVYHPGTKHYYGVVWETGSKQIIWRFDYGTTCPRITARATKLAGEMYGRGRAMLALADARTLDKLQEFILRNAAIEIAGLWTGVSDGVMNPYTVSMIPGAVVPVASNDNANPSLRRHESGGNFNLGLEMLTRLQEKVRKTLMGPEMSAGPIKTATEITISDRNRMWAMNGEFSRIQVELLAKIVIRGVTILQNRGLIPRFKIDGQEVTIRFVSPFAKSQDSEDLMSLEQTVMTMSSLGPEALHLQLKTEDFGKFIGEKTGLDPALIRSPEERDQKAKEAAEALQAAQQAGVDVPGASPAAPGVG